MHPCKLHIWLFCLAILGFPSLGTAQSNIWESVGYVVDAESGEPLAGAQVVQQGKTEGTLTDQYGKFSLLVTGEAPVLIAKSLGYAPQLLRATQQVIKFRLQPDGVKIGTVEITQNRVELAYPDEETHIFDYDFYGDNLLLIVHDKKRKAPKLILVDDRDSILSEHFGASEPPRSLFKDCLGNRHAISDNYAGQIHVDDDELLITRDNLREFEASVMPCTAVLQNSYFLYYRGNDQIESYEVVNVAKNNRRTMVTLTDTFALYHMRDDAIMAQKGIDMSSAGTQGARSDFQRGLDARFKKEVQFRPTYSPMGIIQNHIFVFDHSFDRILKFNHEGNFVDFVGITYPDDRDWAYEVIIDEEEQNAYTLFEKNGFYTLKRIDLETGELAAEWDLEKKFITNIKVRDGKVYFLYREAIYDPVKRLYQLQL